MMTKKISEKFSAKMVSILIISVTFFVFTGKVKAQTNGAQDEIYIVADEMPIFPGGTKALLKVIYSNITYPQDAKDNGIEGKVTVRFVINKDGKTTQATIAKGLYPSIDKAVLSAIEKVPVFTPGKIAGKPVSVWYALPITFKLLEN